MSIELVASTIADRAYDRIRTDILLPDNAWKGVPHADGSDGVEFVAAASYADGRREILQKRYFDPRSHPAERGVQPIDWTVELPAGAQLELSVNTVAVHRANIMNALGVHKTAELVVYALQNGLVNPL